MKKILLILIMSIFLFSLVSAECSIPTVKQGDTIQLTQSCTDCLDGVNVTKVLFPNPNLTDFLLFRLSFLLPIQSFN